MNEPTLTCKDEQRRDTVREKGFNGLDYLEVSDDQRTLTVYFLSKAPEGLVEENVRITGGRRVRDIEIVGFKMCYQEDPERDDCMIVTVDKPGDFSTYTLCLVDLDDGQPTDRPLPDLDPRYACLEFSFKAGCPSDLDCKPQAICPPEELAEPEINYLAKDYASFRQLILDRLALIMPDWQERHVPDVGVVLVELLAYVGDHLSYYQDAVATEAYLDTARQRISVRRHARLVDYHMHGGCNARAWVCVDTDADLALDPSDVYFITGKGLPVSSTVLTPEDLRNIPASQYEVFEPLVEKPDQPMQLYAAHSEIHFYTWGDRECCLPRGATSATLRDGVGVEILKKEQGVAWVPDESEEETRRPIVQIQAKEPQVDWDYQRELHLEPGDVLIFEEVKGPKTSNPADADPAHRHAVYLTNVEEAVDELYHQPVIEIEWAEADALPFPICISTIGPPHLQCSMIKEVSVARGNVILVDHGRRIEAEDLGVVPARVTRQRCEGQGRPSDIEILPALFRPVLQHAPLTFRQPLPVDGPASRLLAQDPRQALPNVDLQSIPPVPGDVVPLFPPAALTDLEALVSLAVKLRWPEEDDEPHDDAEKRDANEGGQQAGSPKQDFASRHLRGLLSHRTRQLLDSWDGSAILPGELEEALIADLGGLLQTWTPRRDLLASRGDDLYYVVEMDDEGRAHLRFGDGELGRRPEAGTAFIATYRVGNGPAGNVGAEMISHIVLRKTRLSGVTLQPRNPLPARGGAAPEPLAEVKLFAPHAFRTELERAVIADDYAALVMRDFKDKVQRAAATLRWNGSWYEVLVAIDPLGGVEADEALLGEIKGYLYRYRRMGHDLAVRGAQYVPLDIQLTVCVLPDYLCGHVKAALLDLFSNRRLPDGRLGFFHPDKLTFGGGIRLSELVALVQSVPGVENVVVDRLKRYGEAPNREIEKGILPLGPFEVARLDNDPSLPGNGQLVLNMEGGR